MEREHLTAAGREQQKAWRCPMAGHALTDKAPDDPACTEALAATATLTGAKGLTTCPCFYASLPHVTRAVRAYRYAERGELRALHPRPAAVLLAAVDLVGRGVVERQAYDLEQARKKSEAK